MAGLLVVVAAAVLSVVAMAYDNIMTAHEFSRLNTELEHCHKLIHGYNER
jgi:hypothetical protein